MAREVLEDAEDYFVLNGMWAEGITRGVLVVLPIAILSTYAMSALLKLSSNILVKSRSDAGPRRDY
mgnify:CR=1 FL=1